MFSPSWIVFLPLYKKPVVRHSGKQPVLRVDFIVSYIGVVSIVNYDAEQVRLLQGSRLWKCIKICFKVIIGHHHQNNLLGFIRRATSLHVSTTKSSSSTNKIREIKATSRVHFYILRLKSQSLGATIYICQYKRRKPIKYLIIKMRVKQCRHWQS